MRVLAVIEQPAVIRQILEHLGLAVPSRAERPPPELTRRHAVAEASEWTYDPRAADLPLMDPLTVSGAAGPQPTRQGRPMARTAAE
jgi:hypothetical protein